MFVWMLFFSSSLHLFTFWLWEIIFFFISFLVCDFMCDCVRLKIVRNMSTKSISSDSDYIIIPCNVSIHEEAIFFSFKSLRTLWLLLAPIGSKLLFVFLKSDLILWTSLIDRCYCLFDYVSIYSLFFIICLFLCS